MRNSKISIVKILIVGIAMLMLGSSNLLAQVSVTLPSVTRQSGASDDTLSIQCGTIATSDNVMAFQFTLYYNKSVVYVTNAVKAGISDVGSSLLQVNADTANGMIKVAWANASAISGSGTLLKLVMHYRNVGTSPLTFDDNGNVASTFMFNAGTPAANVTNGSVSIPSIAVSFGNVNATVGDTVMIPVSTSALSSADNVMAYDFNASYSASVLKIVGYSTTNTLSAGGVASINNNVSGIVKFAWASASKITSASGGVLVYLKAVAEGAGTSSLDFTSIEYNAGTPVVGGVSGSFKATTLATYSISGSVTYQNASSTPVQGAVVTLTPQSGTAVMDTTDTAGAYSFAGLLPGTFTVSVAKTTGWGGVNAADALEAARYYNSLTTLDTLQILAGDVTGNGMVNNSDALDIVKRFVNLISSFAIPDWTFYPGTSNVTITNANVTNNIKALAAGDINESFVPGVIPKVAALSLTQNSEINIKNGASFEVPISIANDLQVGALSLKLSYPQNMVKFDGISVNGNLLTNEKNGIVTIGWVDLTGGQKPMNLKAGSVIANLKFTAKEGFTNGNKFGFDLLPGSEIVDSRGNAVASSEIQAPEVTMSVPSEFSVEQNYPNPFNPSTTIEFSIPESGNVTLTIYNITGQVVTRLVNGVQNAGAHHVVWNASNLSSGVYFYRIDFDGQNKKFSDIKSMVLLK